MRYLLTSIVILVFAIPVLSERQGILPVDFRYWRMKPEFDIEGFHIDAEDSVNLSVDSIAPLQILHNRKRRDAHRLILDLDVSLVLISEQQGMGYAKVYGTRRMTRPKPQNSEYGENLGSEIGAIDVFSFFEFPKQNDNLYLYAIAQGKILGRESVILYSQKEMSGDIQRQATVEKITGIPDSISEEGLTLRFLSGKGYLDSSPCVIRCSYKVPSDELRIDSLGAHLPVTIVVSDDKMVVPYTFNKIITMPEDSKRTFFEGYIDIDLGDDISFGLKKDTISFFLFSGKRYSEPLIVPIAPGNK